MSMSNYEIHLMLGCFDCDFADKAKLEEMKEYHDKKMWVECSNVGGSCTFAFKRNMQQTKNGFICLENTDKKKWKHNPNIECPTCGKKTLEVWNQKQGYYDREIEEYIETISLTHVRCTNCGYADTS